MYKDSEAGGEMADLEASTQIFLPTEGDNSTVALSLLCHQKVGNDQKICYMERIGYGLIVPTISCVGIIFNILNLVTLRSRKLQESTYTYLTGLAIADLLSLFFFGVNCIGRGYFPGGHYGWRVFEVYMYWPFGTITTVASVILTVTVTIERFVFIYRPHHARTWCIPAVARRITAVVFILCALCNIPRFFVFTIKDSKLTYTDFSKSHFYITYAWMHFFTISVGSALVLIVFNVLLIQGIHRTNRRRHCMVGRHRNSLVRERQDEMRLTKTLIAVIFLFIFGEIPSALASRSIVVGVIGRGDAAILSTYTYKVCVMVATILVVNQHSLNFVIYCVFNRKFWAVFRRKLCPCVMKRIKTSDTSTCSQMPMAETSNSPKEPEQVSFQSAWGLGGL